MPRKPKTATEAQTALPSIPKELIDQFVKGPMTAEAVHAASAAFKKALIERALGAELGHHLGYPAGAVRPEDATNQRNGKSGKTVLTDDGPLRLEIPRDRDGSFAPILIPKHERRFTGFDDKIIAMYDAKLVPVGRPRHDGARDPGVSGRAVRHRGVARVHQLGN
jgi:putative transposase